MKSIKSNYKVLLVSVFTILGIVFTGCEMERETEITPKTLEQYKADLSGIVSSEKAIVENCVVGYNKGDFRNETLFPEYTADYLAALVAAEAVLAKPDLTIADIMAANYDLSSPGKLFNDELFISDRRPIHELIIYCDTLRVHTPIGTEAGSAPQEAHDQFNAAIVEAKGVRSRGTTIERQVTEAVDKLNPELEIFENAIVK